MVEEYKHSEEFENNCGFFRETYRCEEFNVVRGRLKRRTGAHYHLEGLETYIVEEGRGKIRVKRLDEEKFEEYSLKKGVSITLEPYEIHQVYSEKELFVLVISSPPWKQENEIKTEDIF